MESPRKFNDCYFYYYSTCTKGDNCVFRHEPSALGCETMCTLWQQGKCLDKRCKLRHMELRKNRKQIPCYWENQPGGCRKIHCPFMHKNPEARTDGIAPSQPAPLPSASAPVEGVPVGVPVGVGGEGMPVPAPPVPAPVPLLWQQQRQEHMPGVVLESSMLGVLPAASELRRMLDPPYLPVDPLVVNFDEESDNESAPSSTPTKAAASPDELVLLERIQAEAAAFYRYDQHDRHPRASIDRLSLDEIAGKKTDEDRPSPDFRVLSLDEIRARKKGDAPAPPQIKLNLCRKRKLSTQEAVTAAGNKIIKVVRSNSIVYKKLDKSGPAGAAQPKADRRRAESESDLNTRKRTISEQSDVFEVHDDELVDNCYEFKRIKIGETTVQNKPRLIRNRNASENKDARDKVDERLGEKLDTDSDNEVQIVSVDLSDKADDIDLSNIYDTEIIDLETARIGDPVDVVDLSEEADDNEVIASDLDIELVKNVPDVVASCHRKSATEKSVISEIDALLDDDL